MPPKRVAKKKKCNDEFSSEFQMDEISQQVEMAGMDICAAQSTKVNMDCDILPHNHQSRNNKLMTK